MRELRFISVQPANLYYAWQVEVMLHNFIEMGVKPNQIDILCYKENGIIPRQWINLYSFFGQQGVNFYFYNDDKSFRFYTSSKRFNILKQHFTLFPELSEKAIFYHDCDIILSKRFDWITEEMLSDDFIYGSNVDWYLNYDYVLSKGREVLNTMCDILRVPSEVVKENNHNTIGAQYLLKGMTADFWARAEFDSEYLYVKVQAVSDKIKASNPDYHELQIWCADMWALLWGLWREGKETRVSKLMDFSWASATRNKGLEDYERCNIMHNAGVTGPNQGLFFKGAYINRLPYDEDLDLIEGASKKYYEWVKEVGKISVLK